MADKVAIIGGYGGMGQLFARLFIKQGCEVLICGPNKVKADKVAKQLGVKATSDNVEAARYGDVVVITVPIAVTAKTIEEVAPHVRKGAMIMDLTSVKTWPCELMEKYCADDVQVLGTHPIFGPRVGSVDGQVFVLTPVRGKKWIKWFRDVLESSNARIIDSTPEEHDKVMAVVQGLTHFAYISVGKTLCDLGLDVKRSRQFSSPVYELMLDMIGRIIGQDPHLYAEIQIQNPEVLKVHETYLTACERLSEAVRSGDEPGFVKMMAQASKHFGDTERAMGRSDKAIGSLVAELKLLQDRVGEKIYLKHMYSGNVHVGVIEKVTSDEVTLRSGGKLRKLKLSNLQVLFGNKIREYEVEKYGTNERDYSIKFSEAADEMLISGLLGKSVKKVVDVSVKDVYKGGKLGDGVKSICFCVKFIQDDVKATDKAIIDFFEGIGGVRR